MKDIVAGIVAGAAGAAVAFLTFRLTVYLMRKKGPGSMLVSFLRSLINVGFLVLAFFIGGQLPYSQLAIVLGAAIGLTVFSTILLFMLARKSAAEEKAAAAAAAGSKESETKEGD